MAQTVDGGFGLSCYRITCYHSCQRETCAERTGSGEPAQLSEAMKISWRPLRWCLVTTEDRRSRSLGFYIPLIKHSQLNYTFNYTFITYTCFIDKLDHSGLAQFELSGTPLQGQVLRSDTLITLQHLSKVTQ